MAMELRSIMAFPQSVRLQSPVVGFPMSKLGGKAHCCMRMLDFCSLYILRGSISIDHQNAKLAALFPVRGRAWS